jgi:broad specificity phosphatase PhoE
MENISAQADLQNQGALHPPEAPRPPIKLLYLVRHGQATFNVEGRLPGQLDGVALTDHGRRQAYRAAVALSAVPLSAVLSSPLERARETAEVIARGGALPVRLDARLKDTDVGPWAGQVIGELEKNDPRWRAFVEHPTEPPEGVESFTSVQARAVTACEDLRRDPAAGDYLCVVAHADVVKLILAHYTRTHVEAARFLSIDNASISALAFDGDQPARLLGLNWTATPGWLLPAIMNPRARTDEGNKSHGAPPPSGAPAIEIL